MDILHYTMSYEWLFRIRWGVVNSIWDLNSKWCWRAIWLPTGLLLLACLHRHNGCGWHRAVADVLGNDSGIVGAVVRISGQRRKMVKREGWWLEWQCIRCVSTLLTSHPEICWSAFYFDVVRDVNKCQVGSPTSADPYWVVLCTPLHNDLGIGGCCGQ